jgi:hypothetical protein
MLVKVARAALIAAPLFAFIVAPPLIGSIEPRVLGMPAIMWWEVLWVLLTPLCLFTYERTRS